MTYADAFNLRTTNVSFNSVADAIDGSFGRAWGGTTAGTSTAYTCTPSPAWTAYTAGSVITVIPHVSCGANATINVNSLGVKSILWRGYGPEVNAILINVPITLVYDGSNFHLVNHSRYGLMYFNTITLRNNSVISFDFDGTARAGMGTNDTASANGSIFQGFLTGGTIRGSITNNNNTGVLYTTTSDYRLKENVEDMGQEALDDVLAMRPVKYQWKETGRQADGFIAHELAEVVPQSVSGVKDAVNAEGGPIYQGVDASLLIGRLVKAVQILEARIKVLEQGGE